MQTASLDQAADRLQRGYRAIRSVTPPDAPWAGTLTRMPDDSSCVLVDADLLGTDWRGWDAAASGHLLSPVDIVRKPGGHDVALPVCTERVDVFLRRRGAGGAPLTDGEVVTLAVSVLRGLAELQRSGNERPVGQWWLTDAGRPVLAADVGDDADAASLLVLTEMRRTLTGRTHVRGVLDDAIDALGDPRVLARDLDRLEQSLFGAAEAAPLAVTMLSSQRARTLAVLEDEPGTDTALTGRPRWADLVATHVDGDIADLTSQTVSRVWRRLRQKPGGRRRTPWLLAGGLAAAVLAIGLAWPPDGPEPAAVDSASGQAIPSPQPGEPPSEGVDATSGDAAATADSDHQVADGSPPSQNDSTAPPEDPAAAWVDAAIQILALRAACGSDQECLTAVVEDPTRSFPEGAIDLPTDQRSLTLLDEFGGAAVLRVDATDSATSSQLIVLVTKAGGHLLRDVHDVAEQAR